MDRSKVQEIVEREIESLMRRLGIPHWNVKVRLDQIGQAPDGWRRVGQCDLRPDYNRAIVEINPDDIDDEQHLMKVLRHELFHILLSPYTVYREIVAQYVPTGTPEDRADTRAYTHFMEQAVVNLERMFQGLTGQQDTPAPVASDPIPGQ